MQNIIIQVAEATTDNVRLLIQLLVAMKNFPQRVALYLTVTAPDT